MRFSATIRRSLTGDTTAAPVAIGISFLRRRTVDWNASCITMARRSTPFPCWPNIVNIRRTLSIASRLRRHDGALTDIDQEGFASAAFHGFPDMLTPRSDHRGLWPKFLRPRLEHRHLHCSSSGIGLGGIRRQYPDKRRNTVKITPLDSYRLAGLLGVAGTVAHLGCRQTSRV